SSARLPFLSHIPDHTDLAPHNPWLTSRLRGYDVIHTTDGTFAAARTAARVSRWHGIPLTSSVHTTTPYYTRVFTAATVARVAGAFGIPPERKVVISVGRLDAIKNVLVLARAVRALVDGGADLHLLCAGKGPDREAVLSLLPARASCPGVLEPETLARAYASA